jgi:hypothetical protein
MPAMAFVMVVVIRESVVNTDVERVRRLPLPQGRRLDAGQKLRPP